MSQYSFFINIANKQQLAFMQLLQAKATGEHTILLLSCNAISLQSINSTILTIIPYNSNYFMSFKKQHTQAFPSTYYDAQTIVSRSNEHHQLLLLVLEERLIGYVYFEVEPLLGEASIEYIAVNANLQSKGHGTALLEAAVLHIFTYSNVEELTLCVASHLHNAHRLYEKIGFTRKAELRSFSLNTRIFYC